MSNKNNSQSSAQSSAVGLRSQSDYIGTSSTHVGASNNPLTLRTGDFAYDNDDSQNGQHDDEDLPKESERNFAYGLVSPLEGTLEEGRQQNISRSAHHTPTTTSGWGEISNRNRTSFSANIQTQNQIKVSPSLSPTQQPRRERVVSVVWEDLDQHPPPRVSSRQAQKAQSVEGGSFGSADGVGVIGSGSFGSDTYVQPRSASLILNDIERGPAIDNTQSSLLLLIDDPTAFATAGASSTNLAPNAKDNRLLAMLPPKRNSKENSSTTRIGFTTEEVLQRRRQGSTISPPSSFSSAYAGPPTVPFTQSTSSSSSSLHIVVQGNNSRHSTPRPEIETLFVTTTQSGSQEGLLDAQEGNNPLGMLSDRASSAHRAEQNATSYNHIPTTNFSSNQHQQTHEIHVHQLNAYTLSNRNRIPLAPGGKKGGLTNENLNQHQVQNFIPMSNNNDEEPNQVVGENRSLDEEEELIDNNPLLRKILMRGRGRSTSPASSASSSTTATTTSTNTTTTPSSRSFSSSLASSSEVALQNVRSPNRRGVGSPRTIAGGVRVFGGQYEKALHPLVQNLNNASRANNLQNPSSSANLANDNERNAPNNATLAIAQLPPVAVATSTTMDSENVTQPTIASGITNERPISNNSGREITSPITNSKVIHHVPPSVLKVGSPRTTQPTSNPASTINYQVPTSVGGRKATAFDSRASHPATVQNNLTPHVSHPMFANYKGNAGLQPHQRKNSRPTMSNITTEALSSVATTTIVSPGIPHHPASSFSNDSGGSVVGGGGGVGVQNELLGGNGSTNSMMSTSSTLGNYSTNSRRGLGLASLVLVDSRLPIPQVSALNTAGGAVVGNSSIMSALQVVSEGTSNEPKQAFDVFGGEIVGESNIKVGGDEGVLATFGGGYHHHHNNNNNNNLSSRFDQPIISTTAHHPHHLFNKQNLLSNLALDTRLRSNSNSISSIHASSRSGSLIGGNNSSSDPPPRSILKSPQQGNASVNNGSFPTPSGTGSPQPMTSNLNNTATLRSPRHSASTVPVGMAGLGTSQQLSILTTGEQTTQQQDNERSQPIRQLSKSLSISEPVLHPRSTTPKQYGVNDVVGPSPVFGMPFRGGSPSQQRFSAEAFDTVIGESILFTKEAVGPNVSTTYHRDSGSSHPMTPTNNILIGSSPYDSTRVNNNNNNNNTSRIHPFQQHRSSSGASNNSFRGVGTPVSSGSSTPRVVLSSQISNSAAVVQTANSSRPRSDSNRYSSSSERQIFRPLSPMTTAASGGGGANINIGMPQTGHLHSPTSAAAKGIPLPISSNDRERSNSNPPMSSSGHRSNSGGGGNGASNASGTLGVTMSSLSTTGGLTSLGPTSPNNVQIVDIATYSANASPSSSRNQSPTASSTQGSMPSNNNNNYSTSAAAASSVPQRSSETPMVIVYNPQHVAGEEVRKHSIFGNESSSKLVEDDSQPFDFNSEKKSKGGLRPLKSKTQNLDRRGSELGEGSTPSTTTEKSSLHSSGSQDFPRRSRLGEADELEASFTPRPMPEMVPIKVYQQQQRERAHQQQILTQHQLLMHQRTQQQRNNSNVGEDRGRQLSLLSDSSPTKQSSSTFSAGSNSNHNPFINIPNPNSLTASNVNGSNGKDTTNTYRRPSRGSIFTVTTAFSPTGSAVNGTGNGSVYHHGSSIDMGLPTILGGRTSLFQASTGQNSESNSSSTTTDHNSATSVPLRLVGARRDTARPNESMVTAINLARMSTTGKTATAVPSVYDTNFLTPGNIETLASVTGHNSRKHPHTITTVVDVPSSLLDPLAASTLTASPAKLSTEGNLSTNTQRTSLSHHEDSSGSNLGNGSRNSLLCLGDEAEVLDRRQNPTRSYLTPQQHHRKRKPNSDNTTDSASSGDTASSLNAGANVSNTTAEGSPLAASSPLLVNHPRDSHHAPSHSSVDDGPANNSGLDARQSSTLLGSMPTLHHSKQKRSHHSAVSSTMTPISPASAVIGNGGSVHSNISANNSSTDTTKVSSTTTTDSSSLLTALDDVSQQRQPISVSHTTATATIPMPPFMSSEALSYQSSGNNFERNSVGAPWSYTNTELLPPRGSIFSIGAAGSSTTSGIGTLGGTADSDTAAYASQHARSINTLTTPSGSRSTTATVNITSLSPFASAAAAPHNNSIIGIAAPLILSPNSVSGARGGLGESTPTPVTNRSSNERPSDASSMNTLTSPSLRRPSTAENSSNSQLEAPLVRSPNQKQNPLLPDEADVKAKPAVSPSQSTPSNTSDDALLVEGQSVANTLLAEEVQKEVSKSLSTELTTVSSKISGLGSDSKLVADRRSLPNSPGVAAASVAKTSSIESGLGSYDTSDAQSRGRAFSAIQATPDSLSAVSPNSRKDSLMVGAGGNLIDVLAYNNNPNLLNSHRLSVFTANTRRNSSLAPGGGGVLGNLSDGNQPYLNTVNDPLSLTENANNTILTNSGIHVYNQLNPFSSHAAISSAAGLSSEQMLLGMTGSGHENSGVHLNTPNNLISNNSNVTRQQVGSLITSPLTQSHRRTSLVSGEISIGLNVSSNFGHKDEGTTRPIVPIVKTTGDESHTNAVGGGHGESSDSLLKAGGGPQHPVCFLPTASYSDNFTAPFGLGQGTGKSPLQPTHGGLRGLTTATRSPSSQRNDGGSTNSKDTSSTDEPNNNTLAGQPVVVAGPAPKEEHSSINEHSMGVNSRPSVEPPQSNRSTIIAFHQHGGHAGPTEASMISILAPHAYDTQLRQEAIVSLLGHEQIQKVKPSSETLIDDEQHKISSSGGLPSVGMPLSGSSTRHTSSPANAAASSFASTSGTSGASSAATVYSLNNINVGLTPASSINMTTNIGSVVPPLNASQSAIGRLSVPSIVGSQGSFAYSTPPLPPPPKEGGAASLQPSQPLALQTPQRSSLASRGSLSFNALNCSIPLPPLSAPSSNRPSVSGANANSFLSASVNYQQPNLPMPQPLPPQLPLSFQNRRNNSNSGTGTSFTSSSTVSGSRRSTGTGTSGASIRMSVGGATHFSAESSQHQHFGGSSPASNQGLLSSPAPEHVDNDETESRIDVNATNLLLGGSTRSQQTDPLFSTNNGHINEELEDEEGIATPSSANYAYNYSLSVDHSPATTTTTIHHFHPSSNNKRQTAASSTPRQHTREGSEGYVEIGLGGEASPANTEPLSLRAISFRSAETALSNGSTGGQLGQILSTGVVSSSNISTQSPHQPRFQRSHHPNYFHTSVSSITAAGGGGSSSSMLPAGLQGTVIGGDATSPTNALFSNPLNANNLHEGGGYPSPTEVNEELGITRGRGGGGGGGHPDINPSASFEQYHQQATLFHPLEPLKTPSHSRHSLPQAQGVANQASSAKPQFTQINLNNSSTTVVPTAPTTGSPLGRFSRSSAHSSASASASPTASLNHLVQSSPPVVHSPLMSGSGSTPQNVPSLRQSRERIDIETALYPIYGPESPLGHVVQQTTTNISVNNSATANTTAVSTHGILPQIGPSLASNHNSSTQWQGMSRSSSGRNEEPSFSASKAPSKPSSEQTNSNRRPLSASLRTSPTTTSQTNPHN